MGGVRNVSSDLHRAVRGGSVRAARVSKKDAADKPKRHQVSAQPIRKISRRANVISQGPPYEEFNSIWESLGFSPGESASLNVRSSLMREIRRIIEKKEWTQAEAAKQCHVSQPRINDLLRGKFHKFSIDALVNMAGALGCDVDVRLRAA